MKPNPERQIVSKQNGGLGNNGMEANFLEEGKVWIIRKLGSILILKIYLFFMWFSGKIYLCFHFQ